MTDHISSFVIVIRILTLVPLVLFLCQLTIKKSDGLLGRVKRILQWGALAICANIVYLVHLRFAILFDMHNAPIINIESFITALFMFVVVIFATVEIYDIYKETK